MKTLKGPDQGTDPARARTPGWAVALWLLSFAGSIALPFEPWGLWLLAPVSLVPLAGLGLAVQGWRTRTLAVLAFASTVPAWLSLEWWIQDVSVLGLPVLACYMGLWSAAELVALRSLARRRPNWPAWVQLSLVAVTFEWLRGELVLGGYPWFSRGVPLVEAPVLAQSADLFGVPMLTLLCAAMSGAIFAIAVPRRRREGLVVVACVVVVTLCYGSWRMHQVDSAQETSRAVELLVVQTDLPTSNKLRWEPRDQVIDVRRWVGLTRDGASEAPPPALVVWPETVLPGFGLEEETVQVLSAGGSYPGSMFRDAIRELSSEVGAPLLVGSHATTMLRVEGDRWAFDDSFNSAYIVGPLGNLQRYDKVFLTPFGETMPVISRWKWLEEQLLALGASGMSFDLSAGARLDSLEVCPAGASPFRIATPICFEDTMAWVVRSLVWDRGVRKAQVIVNLSNDGWFGSSVAGRRHHLQMARARAIENRTELVRCANTGISCQVDAAGRLVWMAAPSEEGAHRLSVRLASLDPPFASIGGVLSPIAAMVLLLGFIPSRRTTRSCASAVLSVVLLASISGCSSGTNLPSASDRPWSTKSASISDPDAASQGGPARLAPAATRQPFAVTSDLGNTQNATDLLLQAAAAPDAELRARAVESLRYSSGALSAVCERLIGDVNPAVRYATCIVIGDQRACELAPLTRPLLFDRYPSVRAGALYALSRCGESVDLTPLGTMLLGESETDRANAATLLGKLGNPSALPLLRTAVVRVSARANPDREAIFLLQVAAAMVVLGDETQLDPLRAALFQPESKAERIGLACQLVEEIRDSAALPHLHRIMSADGPQTRPMELRIVAATAFVRLGGGPLAGPEYLGMEGAKSASPTIRASAAFLLGAVGTPDSRTALSVLLADEDSSVQIAAAAAILRGPAGSRGLATGS
ncbi:MAG: apolipoprotein N-acyltransferase [Planctomycetota bacterium]|nr:apolipoprotein N-acyltransferase [Planctomycetota bacterium]MDA1106057.1 apolipoprotein N-acyltransferase [Planctomycetota bacterium]